jgi:hypothetical protein
MCKAHVPTEVTRALAFGLVVNGVTKKQVARHIGIDVKTLAVHYEAEVEFGLQKASVQVASALLKLALKPSPGMPSFNAMKLWLGAKAGWTEKKIQQIDLPDSLVEAAGLSARETIAKKLTEMHARNVGPEDGLET